MFRVFFSSNIFSEIFHHSYIYMGHRHCQVVISSVPNLDFLSSDNASSTNIVVKLIFVTRLFFRQSLDIFHRFFFKNPACDATFVNFRAVYRTLAHIFDDKFVTTEILTIFAKQFRYGQLADSKTRLWIDSRFDVEITVARFTIVGASLPAFLFLCRIENMVDKRFSDIDSCHVFFVLVQKAECRKVNPNFFLIG